MKDRILLFFALVILLSCANTPRNYQDFVNRKLQENYSTLLSNYSHIVIIPRKGCNACTKRADSFFNKNKNKNDYLFIFTKLTSEKQLRIELGYENLLCKNVILDKENLFYCAEFGDSEYPLLLKKDIYDNFQYEVLH